MFFDPFVRDKLTVSFARPRRAWWEAGRTYCPTSDSPTSFSSSYSFKERNPHRPCVGLHDVPGYSRTQM